MFRALLKVNDGIEFNGSGKTIADTLRDVSPWSKELKSIFFFKTKGELILTLTEKGKKPKTIIQHLWPMQMRRIFSKYGDTLAHRVLIKRLEEGLKAGLSEKTPAEFNDQI